MALGSPTITRDVREASVGAKRHVLGIGTGGEPGENTVAERIEQKGLGSRAAQHYERSWLLDPQIGVGPTGFLGCRTLRNRHAEQQAGDDQYERFS